MKQLDSLLIVLAMALLALVGCTYVNDPSGFARGDLKVVTNLTQQGDIPLDVKALEVDNRFGELRVTGAEGGPMQWTWKLTVRARTEALAEQAVAGATCRAMGANPLRLVVTLPDSNGKFSFQSDLDVRVPKAIAVRTQNRFGQTEVSDVGGEVDARGQNGSMTIRNIGGKVQAQTSFATMKVTTTGPASLQNQNGEIEARGIHGPLDAHTSFASLLASDISGSVKLHNQNGSIEAVKVAGNADLKTSFAPVKVQGLQGDLNVVNQNGEVEAKEVTGAVKASSSFAMMDIEASGSNFVCHNQNGALRLHARSATLTNLEAHTSFAPLEVRLPAGLKPAIHARTSFADVESDFPVLMKPRGVNPFTEVEAGTPRITLENQNGNIRIVRE